MSGDLSDKPIFKVTVARNKGKPETLDGFYALHYNSTRVNFAAHQQKTLALAEDIAKQADERQQSIAVLGGGIGGVTCFLGLRAFGCEKVQLYEAGPRAIGVQAGCYHRHGHPTAIEWPRTPVSCTTNLPLLNWGAGSADAIQRQMMEDTLEGRLIQRFANEGIIHFNTVVNKIERENKQWRLRLSNRKPDINVLADIVIYAMGFGLDQGTEWSRAESYWWDDNLENYLRDRHFYGSKAFMVTGRGDGALIDFSRIALGRGMVGDTVPRMLSTLRDARFLQPTISPEFDVRRWETLSDIETLLKEEKGDFDDLQAWTANSDVPEAFATYREGLWEQVNKTHASNAKVKLVAQHKDEPLGGRGSEGAFANRLLFATLMGLDHSGRLEDALGKIEQGENGKPFIRWQNEDGSDGGTHPVEAELIFVRYGPGRKAYLLGRLGYDPEKDELLDPPEDSFDVGAKFKVDLRAEFLKNLCPPDSRLPSDAKVVAWDYRQNLVERYLCDIVGLERVEVRFRCDPEGRGYLEICAPIDLDTASDAAERNHTKMIDCGGFDLQMFGGPVAWTHRETEPVYSATSVATAGALA